MFQDVFKIKMFEWKEAFLKKLCVEKRNAIPISCTVVFDVCLIVIRSKQYRKFWCLKIL